MGDAKLGQLIEGNPGRDAIHIAILPVFASESLQPGQHVGLLDLKAQRLEATTFRNSKLIGIVDPFLKTNVRTGEQFFLCLYPQTITALKHVWTHPDLPDEIVAPLIPESADEKRASESWLKDYVRKHCCNWEDKPDGGYLEFLHYVEWERWIYYAGSDCHGLNEVKDADELFHHLSVVLGRKIDASYFEAFTCSC